MCGLAACAGLPICNRTLIGQHNLTAANGGGPSDNCSLAQLLIGWLSDLEQWRDVRESKSCARALLQECVRGPMGKISIAIRHLHIGYR